MVDTSMSLDNSALSYQSFTALRLIFNFTDSRVTLASLRIELIHRAANSTRMNRNLNQSKSAPLMFGQGTHSQLPCSRCRLRYQSSTTGRISNRPNFWGRILAMNSSPTAGLCNSPWVRSHHAHSMAYGISRILTKNKKSLSDCAANALY